MTGWIATCEECGQLHDDPVGRWAATDWSTQHRVDYGHDVTVEKVSDGG